MQPTQIYNFKNMNIQSQRGVGSRVGSGDGWCQSEWRGGEWRQLYLNNKKCKKKKKKKEYNDLIEE